MRQNTDLALDYLTVSAEQGYEIAQAFLAYTYSQGAVVKQDTAKAIDLYEQAAKNNNVSALLNLGLIYYTGNGTEKNYTKALFYFQKINLAMYPIVGRYLGDIYQYYDKVQNMRKSIYYYEFAAKNNDLDALFNLAELYRTSDNSIKDAPQAIALHTYGASKNAAASQYALGIIYANGDGVEPDLINAYAWLSFASEQGLSNATIALSQISGRMTPSELEQARQQVVHIQQNVLGKIPAPFDSTYVEASPQDNTQPKAMSGVSRPSTTSTPSFSTSTPTINKPRTLKRRRR